MPEVQSTSWADKLAEAAKNAPVAFEPLPVNERFNFEIREAEDALPQSQSGVPYIKYTAYVVDGPRKDSRIYESTHPNGQNIGMFLSLYKSVGLSEDWLLQSDPSEEDIAKALVGKRFSAETYISKNAREDKNRNKFRSLGRFKPMQAASDAPVDAPTTIASAPAPDNNWGATDTTQDNPWGGAAGGSAPAAPWA